MKLITAMKRVAKGAEWLDRKHPGWHNQIDLTKFNIKDANVCVIGSVLGDYGRLVKDVDPGVWSDKNADKTEKWAVKHGFNAADSGEEFGGTYVMESDYSLLQELWLLVIRDRRN